MVTHSCGINKKMLLFSHSTDKVSKYTILGVVMLSPIYLPFALGLNIIRYILNSIYACQFIVTKIIAKSQIENLTFSQMTFREISRLNRTTPLQISINLFILRTCRYVRVHLVQTQICWDTLLNVCVLHLRIFCLTFSHRNYYGYTHNHETLKFFTNPRLKATNTYVWA